MPPKPPSPRLNAASPSPLPTNSLPSTPRNNNLNNYQNTKDPKPKPPPPTHFLCIPLAVTPQARKQLSASLGQFKQDVCDPSLGYDHHSGHVAPAVGGGQLPVLGSGSAGAFALPEDAVRPVGTVHLTLGVFGFGEGKKAKKRRDDPEGQGQARREGEETQEQELSGPEKLAKATSLLQSLPLKEIWSSVVQDIFSRISGKLPSNSPALSTLLSSDRPSITLKGLASMQPPSRAAVLYAPPVDELGALQLFCERVRDVFRQEKLMTDEGRPLLLHATVVNTIYIKNPNFNTTNDNRRGGHGRGGKGKGRNSGGGGGKWDRLVFDATGIIERYEEKVWVQDVPVDRVAICKMGAKKCVLDGVEDEAYEVEAEVEF